MFPSSLAVILAGLVTVIVALGAFGWAWSRGQFGELEAQARVLLDDRDCRAVRPWESPRQRAERMERHGAPLDSLPGEQLLDAYGGNNVRMSDHREEGVQP